MTISELLDELKQVDPITYKEISISFAWAEIQWAELYPEYEDDRPHLPVNIAINEYESDLIQGCIQRACEKREWTWCIYKQTPEEKNSHYADISKIVSGYDGDYWHEDHESCITWEDANSPAEALLAAYVAAVKKEGKQ